MSPAALDELVAELVAVSCRCEHADHGLDVFRHRDTRELVALRLGPCFTRGCPCSGGRA
jgi:hypothetical protein